MGSVSPSPEMNGSPRPLAGAHIWRPFPGSGERLLRIDAAGPGGPLAVPDLIVVVPEEPVQLADVADLGPAGVRAQDPLRVGDHAHDLPSDQGRLAEDVDRVAE